MLNLLKTKLQFLIQKQKKPAHQYEQVFGVIINKIKKLKIIL